MATEPGLNPDDLHITIGVYSRAGNQRVRSLCA
jgi:hypothetical protein